MSESGWRAGRFLLPAFVLLWLGMTIAVAVGPDAYGPAFRLDNPGLWRATVTGASPELQTLGIVPGAHIRLDAIPWVDRIRLRYGAKDAEVRVPLETPSGIRLIAVRETVPRAADLSQRIFGAFSAALAFLLVGYLGYRRPSAMLFALILFIGGGGLSWSSFAAQLFWVPAPIFAVIAWTLRDLCNIFPVLVLASFAIRLPGTAPSPQRLRAIRVIDAIVVAGFFLDIIAEQSAIGYAVMCALWALVLLCASVLSLRLAQPEDRARVGIVFAAIMIGGVGYAITMIAFSLGRIPFTVFLIYTTLSIDLIPIAVTYAILKHRVFDIEFVLNRTVVYGMTSAILLLMFAALEFFAERVLRSLTRVESAVVEFVIAIVVVVSARVVHARVDRVVDNMLFRTRHAQESALVRYAGTAQFYTSTKPLIRDTLETVGRYALVDGAAVYLAVNGGLTNAGSSWLAASAEIEENDIACADLRAHHEPRDLHDLATAFPGARAYPMTLAGRLVGVLCTGDRARGEAMPPDIDEAVTHIAAAVAIAVAAIETDAIREENALLHRRLSTLAPAT
ncbi:MAG TPA: GAF domain-containing protein [Candidatus Elarobacter sp.]|jgi:hypothetical protein